MCNYIRLGRLISSMSLIDLAHMKKREGAAMNNTFRLTLSFLIITCFAGSTLALGLNDRLDLADFASHPEAFAGRMIEVNAQVIAINADGKGLELFDSQSRTRISVRLTQLRKSERAALMCSDVRRVLVSGRASVVGGRLTIDAQSVQPLAPNAAAQVETKAAGDHGR